MVSGTLRLQNVHVGRAYLGRVCLVRLKELDETCKLMCPCCLVATARDWSFMILLESVLFLMALYVALRFLLLRPSRLIFFLVQMRC